MAGATGRWKNFPDECRLVVVGRSGSGKSSVVNAVLGEDLCEVAMWAESITKEAKLYSRRRFGKDVRVVDTPGLFDSRPCMPNKKVIKELASTALLLAPGPHAFLLVLPIGHRFTDEEKAVVKHLRDVFGDAHLKHTIVVFTHGDKLRANQKTIESYIEHSPSDLKSLLNEACQRYVVFDNACREACVRKLLDEVDKMARRSSCAFYNSALFGDAEQVVTTTETEFVGTWSGNRPLSELNRNDVVSIITEIRSSRTSLKDEDLTSDEALSKDKNFLLSLLSRVVRSLIRSDLSEGRQPGAIERMIASPSMVGIVPLLPNEIENSNATA